VAGRFGLDHPNERWHRFVGEAKPLLASLGKNRPSDLTVHWAAHAQLNKFPRMIVTKDVLYAITLHIEDCLKNLFYGKRGGEILEVHQLDSLVMTFENQDSPKRSVSDSRCSFSDD